MKIKDKVLKEVQEGDFPKRVLDGDDYDKLMFVLKKAIDLTLAEVGKVIESRIIKLSKVPDDDYDNKTYAIALLSELGFIKQELGI